MNKMTRKILLVAKRDYLAAIRSKAFLFSLVIAPVMGGGSFIGVAVMKAKPDIQERRVAIVDRTGVAAAAVIEAAREKNAEDLFDKVTGRQMNPRYVFETVVGRRCRSERAAAGVVGPGAPARVVRIPRNRPRCGAPSENRRPREDAGIEPRRLLLQRGRDRPNALRGSRAP